MAVTLFVLDQLQKHFTAKVHHLYIYSIKGDETRSGIWVYIRIIMGGGPPLDAYTN